jgi:hypothetical protein
MLLETSEDPVSDKAQFGVIYENFIQSRNTYLDRVRIKNLDNLILGVHSYLT